MGKTKAKREYPLDGKTTFGLSTMRWTITAAMSLTTTAFLLYLTDYSGIGAAAATVGTILLLAGRLFDEGCAADYDIERSDVIRFCQSRASPAAHSPLFEIGQRLL